MNLFVPAQWRQYKLQQQMQERVENHISAYLNALSYHQHKHNQLMLIRYTLMYIFYLHTSICRCDYGK